MNTNVPTTCWAATAMARCTARTVFAMEDSIRGQNWKWTDKRISHKTGVYRGKNTARVDSSYEFICYTLYVLTENNVSEFIHKVYQNCNTF